jgi:hypothetical protein
MFYSKLGSIQLQHSFSISIVLKEVLESEINTNLVEVNGQLMLN